MNLSDKIQRIRIDTRIANLNVLTCQSPAQVYCAGFNQAIAEARILALSSEEYIRQLEGIAHSVMPESMVQAIRKECGYE